LNHRLTAIEDRLFRANENFDELKRLIRDHFASDVFNLTGEYDPDEDRGLRLLDRAVIPPPIRVFTLVGDILHEYRSALDWLAWQLVEEHGAGEPGDNTKWPVLHVRPTAYKKGPNRGKHPPPHIEGGVSPTALAIIDDAQPYQWQEAFAAHPLYILHWLNIRDKHRHIAIRGVNLVDTLVYGDDPIPKFTWTAQLIESTEDGAKVRLVPDDPEVDVYTETTLHVMLHEEAGGPHSPLLQTLTQIQEAVWTTFRQVERECFPPDGPHLPTP
jgi:hypothetical protein